MKAFAFYSRSDDDVLCSFLDLLEIRKRRIALNISVDDVFSAIGDKLCLEEPTDIDRLENGEFRLVNRKYKILSNFYDMKEKEEIDRQRYIEKVKQNRWWYSE